MNKKIGNPNTGSEDIQSRYRDGIWYGKMSHAKNEMPKTTNDGRNRTSKSRKNQNTWKKRNLTNPQILRNIRSGHQQTCRDENIKIKKNTSGERENYTKPKYIAEI